MTEFVSRKYGTNGFEIIIKTDSEEHYKAAEAFARRLIDHTKPVTAADETTLFCTSSTASGPPTPQGEGCEEALG